MTLTVPVDEIVARNANGLLGKHESWERVRLANVATIQNGAAFKSEHFNSEGRGMPLLRIRDVLSDRTAAYYDGPYENDLIVEPGDLIIGMDGDFSSALWAGPRALLNQRVCRVDFKTDTLGKRFAFHAIQGYLDAVNEVTSSVTVKHLSSRTVAELPLPLPPRAEQDRIVQAIESRLTSARLAEASLLQAEEDICRFEVILRRDTLTRARALVDASTPLTSLVTILDRLRVPVNRKERATRQGAIPYYGATGQVGWIDDHLFDEELVPLGEDGVGFLDPMAQKAYVIRGKSWVNNHAHVLRADRDKIRSRFLCHMLNAIDYRDLVGGTTRLKLTQASLRKIALPTPDLATQDVMLSELDRQLAARDAASESLRSTKAGVEALRTSILREAFSGRLVPQDAADRSASEPPQGVREEQVTARIRLDGVAT